MGLVPASQFFLIASRNLPPSFFSHNNGKKSRKGNSSRLEGRLGKKIGICGARRACNYAGERGLEGCIGHESEELLGRWALALLFCNQQWSFWLGSNTYDLCTIAKKL